MPKAVEEAFRKLYPGLRLEQTQVAASLTLSTYPNGAAHLRGDFHACVRRPGYPAEVGTPGYAECPPVWTQCWTFISSAWYELA